MDAAIRAATSDDAEAIGRMHRASWQEAYAHLLPEGFFTPAGEAERIERWRADLAASSPEVMLRIAVRGDEVVGMASSGPARANETAGPPVRDRELWALHVRAGEYGSGLAHRLLAAVLPDDVPAELGPTEPVPVRREAV